MAAKKNTDFDLSPDGSSFVPRVEEDAAKKTTAKGTKDDTGAADTTGAGTKK